MLDKFSSSAFNFFFFFSLLNIFDMLCFPHTTEYFLLHLVLRWLLIYRCRYLKCCSERWTISLRCLYCFSCKKNLRNVANGVARSSVYWSMLFDILYWKVPIRMSEMSLLVISSVDGVLVSHVMSRTRWDDARFPNVQFLFHELLLECYW